MIKNVTVATLIEYYFDCIYCGAMITQNTPDPTVLENEDLTTEGNIVHCPKCKKTMRIERIII